MYQFPGDTEFASTAQKKFFFKLCSELGIDSEKAKQRAKTIYKLDSFADISKYQIHGLIDKLQQQVAKNVLLKILKTNRGKGEEDIANEIIKNFKLETLHVR